MSETATSREYFRQYCIGRTVLDLGYGGDAVVPWARTFDLPATREEAERLGLPMRYTTVGEAPQHYQGSVRDLSTFCPGSYEVVHASHLWEDFSYPDLAEILRGPYRVLSVGGFLLTNCPYQQVFLAHCAATGQGVNDAHVEQDFSLETFCKVVNSIGGFELYESVPSHGAYSFLTVHRKIG